MRRKWLVGVLVVFSLLAGACGDDDDGGAAPDENGGTVDNGGATDVGVTATEVRVAIVSERTGGAATGTGLGFNEGFEAYIEKVNEEGGIHGRNIVVVAEHDDTGDPIRDAALFQQAFERDNVFTVVACTSKFGALDYINESELPVVGCGFDVEWDETEFAFGVLPTRPTEFQPNADVAYVMAKLGLTKVAVFGHDHPASKGGAERVCQWAEENYGMECVFEDYTLAFGFTDIGASIQKLRESGAEFAFGNMSAGSVLTLIRSTRRAGLDLPTFGPVAPSAEEAAGSADLIEDFFAVQSYPPFDGDNPAMQELVAEVRARKPGTALSFTVVNGWMAGELLVEGLEGAGPRVTREGFRLAIRSMDAFDPGVGAVVDFTTSPDEKIREGIKPDPSLCAGYLLRGDPGAGRMVQVGEKPQLCLSGIETPEALAAKLDDDDSSLDVDEQ